MEIKDILLYYASRMNNLDLVKKLIRYGVDVNSHYYNMTPLMEAATNGHADIVEYLIKNGADVNAQDEIGTTSLIYAA
jgi:ankyrin repeat protein